MIQHAWKNRMARNKLNKLAKWYDNKIKEQSAVIVQTHVRGTLARMQIKHMKDGRDYAAAQMIQCAYRRRLARRKVEELKRKTRQNARTALYSYTMCMETKSCA